MGKQKTITKNKMTLLLKVVTILCSLVMIIVLFVPMWKIELSAPQYPEGLVLKIWPNKLAGDVEIINGLNHYIGMRHLHTEDFIEFTILPYIIMGFSLMGLITLLLNRKKLFYTWVILFFIICIVSMFDFYIWEYEYGHELNPDAPIKVPGMAYQPPLIGYKKLLNFGAYSVPDIGGWIFVSTGIILLTTLFINWKYRKKI